MLGLETMIAMGAVVIFFGFFLMFVKGGKRFGFFSIGMVVVGLLIVAGALAMNPCLFLKGVAC